jgi:hypothetical protein
MAPQQRSTKVKERQAIKESLRVELDLQVPKQARDSVQGVHIGGKLALDIAVHYFVKYLPTLRLLIVGGGKCHN